MPELVFIHPEDLTTGNLNPIPLNDLKYDVTYEPKLCNDAALCDIEQQIWLEGAEFVARWYMPAVQDGSDIDRLEEGDSIVMRATGVLETDLSTPS
jgi:hypothetical protein